MGERRDLATSKRLRFILRLLLTTATKYLVYLARNHKEVDCPRRPVAAFDPEKEVLELLKYQKSLTLFTTGLKSNELMMERLPASRFAHLSGR